MEEVVYFLTGQIGELGTLMLFIGILAPLIIAVVLDALRDEKKSQDYKNSNMRFDNTISDEAWDNIIDYLKEMEKDVNYKKYEDERDRANIGGENNSTNNHQSNQYTYNNYDPYKVMNLPKDATKKDIRNRYRELIKKYHPDMCSESNKQQAETLTQSINKAYTTIMKTYKDGDN